MSRYQTSFSIEPSNSDLCIGEHRLTFKNNSVVICTAGEMNIKIHPTWPIVCKIFEHIYKTVCF